MIEVHVYGRLRALLPGDTSGHTRVVHLEARPGETLGSLLDRLGIPPEALYSVFLNGGLLATRNRMARWLVYPQARQGVRGQGSDAVLEDGDRLGLFGEDMASLVV